MYVSTLGKDIPTHFLLFSKKMYHKVQFPKCWISENIIQNINF